MLTALPPKLGPLKNGTHSSKSTGNYSDTLSHVTSGADGQTYLPQTRFQLTSPERTSAGHVPGMLTVGDIPFLWNWDRLTFLLHWSFTYIVPTIILVRKL